MNEEIRQITLAIFKDLPFSKQTENAKNNIANSLSYEYEKELINHTEIQALGYIMSHFGTLESAASLAGYSAEDIAYWKSGKNIFDLTALRKIFCKARRNAYLCSFFFTISCLFLCSLILWRNIFSLPFVAISAALSFLFYCKVRKYKGQFNSYETCFTSDGRNYIQSMYDRYGKRLINSLAFAVSLLFLAIIAIIQAPVSSHMKPEETTQYIFNCLYFFSIAVYIILKNILCKRLTDCFLFDEQNKKFKKHLLIISTVSAAYCLAIFIITLLPFSHMDFITHLFMLSVAIPVLALFIYNLTLRKDAVFKNIVINKKRITAFSLAVVIVASYQFMHVDSWLLQPYISSVPTVNHAHNEIVYDEDTGVYTITSNKDDFKILQLTDIHLGGSPLTLTKDQKALEAVYTLIKHTEPDLVIVTGDLVYPMGILSFSLNNYAPAMQFASFMRNIGIPWAFVYGNHDTESIAKSSAEDMNEMFKSVSYRSSQNLLYPYIQPDITGRNNQIIEIRNSDGSLNQALFLIDSNAYTGVGLNDYDYIHDDQVDWYEKNIKRLNAQEGKTISSMLFFHIPLQEYREAYNLYTESSDEVKYFFGENGETMIDKVCCSDYPSKLFDTAVRLGSTKAMFCGHDHYNNLSVEYRRIRLTYGLSIDYLAMPGIANDTAQRGGTLITLHSDSEFDIEQFKLVDIEYIG